MQTIENIWKEYHLKLTHFVNKRVNDASLSEDIVQEIMIKVNAKLDTLESSKKIQGWIYQIARNTIIDYYRAKKTYEELPENITSLEVDETKQARQEISSCLGVLIDNLPSDYREAITLSEIENFTQKEVALKQSISLSGAKSRIQRGRGLLKNMLMECCTFEMDHKDRFINYQSKSDCDCLKK
ncbi:MAG TPA: RNA polymerase sigma factor SigZ [Gammaproteobacteria bacterium]|nr:RNA polymerase sigma factor SigZ [Gammaproteobacteria bacterium]